MLFFKFISLVLGQIEHDGYKQNVFVFIWHIKNKQIGLLRKDVIIMSRTWDKEKIQSPNRNIIEPNRF